MDSLEDFWLEDIDPWDVNIGKLSRNLKDGLDINMLATTGTDIEFVPRNVDEVKEQEQQAVEELDVYHKAMFNHLNPECADFDDDKRDEDDMANMTPFAKMALGMNDLTGDGQVLKKILTPGLGPTVPEGSLVRVHYNGYLEYSDEPYDSSRLRNKEQQFKLGKGEVIAGWEIALATMKKGELARLLIQPSYAFGKFGCPPRIPPNATIMFEIELRSSVDLNAADSFESYSHEEKEKISLDELLVVANSIREEGNDCFNQRNVHKAACKYRKAVVILEKQQLKDEDEEKKWKVVLVKLLLNQSLCSVRMGQPKLAIVQCRKVLDLEEMNTKATFRMGQAYMQLSDFGRARRYLTKAGRLSPGNVEIRQELDKLDKAVKKFKAIEKTMCSKMFPSDSPLESEQRLVEGEDDGISSEKLHQYYDLYHEKFSSLCSDLQMMQTIVPLPLPKAEQTIVEEVAARFNLLSEMIPHCGLKVYKPLPKELQELMENH